MFILPNKIHKFIVSCFPKFISTSVTIFFKLKVLYYIWDINMKRITSIVLNMKDVNMIYIFLYLILNLNVNPKVHEAMIFDWILSMFWGLCNDLIYLFLVNINSWTAYSFLKSDYLTQHNNWFQTISLCNSHK